jgi:capsular polysaccharide biosynthesis protein
VAERVAQLEAEATGLRAQYQTIGGKLMNAQVSAKMETEQKGERLTLSDPPVVPEVPTSPNRLLLIAGGTLAGLGLGVALILLLELLYRPIRGTQSLAYAAGRPPLVVIPDLEKKPHALLRFLQSRSRRKLAKSRARAA